MGQIPAFCRTFTGRTHDLPFLRQNLTDFAGICRPNVGPKPTGIDANNLANRCCGSEGIPSTLCGAGHMAFRESNRSLHDYGSARHDRQASGQL